MGSQHDTLRDLLGAKSDINRRWHAAHAEVALCEAAALALQRAIPVGTQAERAAAWAAWTAAWERWDAALTALDAIGAESRANTEQQLAALGEIVM